MCPHLSSGQQEAGGTLGEGIASRMEDRLHEMLLSSLQKHMYGRTSQCVRVRTKPYALIDKAGGWREFDFPVASLGTCTHLYYLTSILSIVTE